MRKRADRFQEKIRGEKDGRHVENSLLSEIGGSKGAWESSRHVGSERHRIQLDSFDDLLFVYPIYCLFFA